MNPMHVYPLNDLREHETDGKPCWCHPEAEELDGETIIIHHSMDGREHHECGAPMH